MNEFAGNRAGSAVAIEMPASPGEDAFLVCLSPCEQDFLKRLAAGHSYHQIADGMSVSINTVRDYVRSVYKKMRVNSRTQAVTKYLRTHIESAPAQSGESLVGTIEATKNIVQVAQATPPSLNLKHRIFLVDDHAMFRDGMRMLIDREPDLMVCGEAAETDEAARNIEKLKPDITIVDLSLSGRTGMDLIKTLKDHHDGLPVLVVSMHEESLYAERALRAGADGYVMKQEPAKMVKVAIRKILDGDIYLSEKMTTSLLGKFIRHVQPELAATSLNKLSNRELNVFRMLGQGKTTRQIAKELGLKSVTINTFRHRIMKKLGFNNSAELVLQANSWTREGV